jgi:hypothetical protein
MMKMNLLHFLKGFWKNNFFSERDNVNYDVFLNNQLTIQLRIYVQIENKSEE